MAASNVLRLKGHESLSKLLLEYIGMISPVDEFQMTYFGVIPS